MTMKGSVTGVSICWSGDPYGKVR